MATVNPEVLQWIRQMGDNDQVIAHYAYQSLLEHVLRTSAPQHEEAQAMLAEALGEALTARAPQKQGDRGGAPADNPFLAVVASRTVAYQHPARVRSKLARLLGYLPHEAAVAPLAAALNDLDAREMARCSLELNPSEKATDALIGALNAAGTVFVVGVVNSLGKRGVAKAAAALRKAVEDSQPEVRIAALYALADVPDAAQDAILEKTARTGTPEERRAAQVARARLAETLRGSGDKAAAERIYRSIMASDADEPQKHAARLGIK